MLLNLAVDSGQFGGDDNKANFCEDINMYVDYVRCFQKTDGYALSVDKGALGDRNADWASKAEKNLIADITADSLVATGGGHDDNGAKGSNKWYLSTQNDATATAEAVTVDNKVWNKVKL